MSHAYDGVHVIIVPDRDSDANPDIPRRILAELTDDHFFISNDQTIMFVRESTWQAMRECEGAPIPATIQ